VTNVWVRSRYESFVDPARQRTKNWYRAKGGSNEIKVVPVLDNSAISPKDQSSRAWVDELHTFDLETHTPFHKGKFSCDGDIGCFEEDVVATLNQSILSLDVSLNTLPFLGWIDEVNVLGVDRSPLIGCRTWLSIGLGEQLADSLGIKRWMNHGLKLEAHLTCDAVITYRRAHAVVCGSKV